MDKKRYLPIPKPTKLSTVVQLPGPGLETKRKCGGGWRPGVYCVSQLSVSSNQNQDLFEGGTECDKRSQRRETYRIDYPGARGISNVGALVVGDRHQRNGYHDDEAPS